MSNEITLENFANPAHSWNAMNDPVMGGKSYSSVTIENSVGVFDGEVKDVPFLKAPGFITMRGEGDYPDVSSCDTLRLTARASEAYSGYRVSFGKKHVPGNYYARGFKADFNPPVGNDMGNIDILFKDFTVRWDDKTGDAIKTCEEDASFCPDIKTLKNMETISLWGEGVVGKVHLEVESIKAIGCTNNAVSRVAGLTDAIDSEGVGGFEVTAPLLFVGVAVVAFVSGLFLGFRKRQGYSTPPATEKFTTVV
jgi:hypothetical protein